LRDPENLCSLEAAAVAPIGASAPRRGTVGEEVARHRALSERLFHEGRPEDALETARLALALAPRDPDILDFCAWLFSNSGRHAEAAELYERLLGIRPDWAEGYRHASGSLAACGRLDEAMKRALDAVRLRPRHAEFALHAGSLLLSAGRATDAARLLQRAAALEPENAAVLRQRSTALWALDRREDAVALALRAFDLAPQDRDAAVHAAELLLRDNRVDEAADIAAAAADDHPEDAVVLRLLSAAEMQCGRLEAALAAIEGALRLAPDDAEYHLHRGGLLMRLGRLDEAAAAFRRAGEIDSTNPAARRSLVSVYVEDGRLPEAIAAGGELLRDHPEDEASAQAVMHALNQRLGFLDADYTVLHERTEREERPARPEPGLFERLCAQFRVLQALIIRETRTRFGESRLGYGWALLEPLLHILMLSAVFALLMHGRPPIGTHFFIFYLTGLIPYFLFVHSSSAMTHAIVANVALLQLPLVTTFDVILARGLLEVVTDVLVAAILLAGFAVAGLPAVPADCWSPAVAAGTAAALGVGCGFVNAVVNRWCKSWDKIWVQLTRVLYFFSGIFYVPGMMPDRMREILTWNPVLQAIDWFRSGFFANYQPHWLDCRYAVIAAALALLVGVGAERGLRRGLSEPL